MARVCLKGGKTLRIQGLSFEGIVVTASEEVGRHVS